MFILIKTTRYSTLFRRLLQAYGEGADIRIERQRYIEADQAVIDVLLREWCNNRTIKRTHEFELRRNGETLFSFHDGPENTIATLSEHAFVDALAQEQIIRYEL